MSAGATARTNQSQPATILQLSNQVRGALIRNVEGSRKRTSTYNRIYKEHIDYLGRSPAMSRSLMTSVMSER
jgi:hypothetical protein